MAEFVGELIAFVVIGFVLWRYVVPPVRTMMRNQQETIRKQVEHARVASERLAAAEKKYQEAIAEARTEAAKIRDTARADAQRIVEEMRQFAQTEVERIRQRGQDDLESQRLQIVRELRARIGELTVVSATELVQTHLADDARRSATVDRFLDQLEAMSAQAPVPDPTPAMVGAPAEPVGEPAGKPAKTAAKTPAKAPAAKTPAGGTRTRASRGGTTRGRKTGSGSSDKGEA